MYNAQHLSNDMKNLGINNGDIVLCHLSYKSLGELENSFDTLTEAFNITLGNEGTLLIPALSWANINKENPHFIAETTPICVGAYPNYFKNLDGVIRSLHPTHSVCAKGAKAFELTKDHYKDTTPVGENSPFYKISKIGGKILMLGCTLLPNTSMHGVEELYKPPYLFKDEKIEYTVENANEKHTAYHTVHNFEGFRQRYDKIDNFLNSTELKCGTIGNATAFLIDSKALWEKCGEIINSDPYYYVEKNN